MPIVYVHGVSIRDDREWDDLEQLLRRYIAPKIADDPENVSISRCYWGEYGAKFRWCGASAPSSPLRTAFGAQQTKATIDKLRHVSLQDLALENKYEKLKAQLNPQPLKKELPHLYQRMRLTL